MGVYLQWPYVCVSDTSKAPKPKVHKSMIINNVMDTLAHQHPCIYHILVWRQYLDLTYATS